MKPKNIGTSPRPDLSVVAYEYAATGAARGYIASQVLPYFDTAIQNGQHPVIPVEALLSLQDTRRAPRSGYNRDDWEYKMAEFSCSENGHEELVDDSESALYASYFDAETVAVRRAVGIIERAHEKRVADKVFNENTFAPHAVAKKWNDGTANPLADVNAGKAAMEDATGLSPNALIITRPTFRALGVNQSVIDRIKFTVPEVAKGELSAGLLAQYFGVERLLVAGGVYNAADKGLDAQVAKIWSPAFAMLAVVSSGGNDLREPCLGRTFLWTADSPTPVVVEDYREENRRSSVIRARQHTDERIQFVAAGYLLKGVHA